MPTQLKLNPKQRAFIREYVRDKNATRAYRAVYGVGQSTAEANGPRMLGNARVKEAIEKQLAKLEAKLELSAERAVAELAKMAFDTKRIKPSDKIRACELVGKHFGAFREVVESHNTHTIKATPEQVDEAAEALIKKL
jgi:phage terminase small subunit